MSGVGRELGTYGLEAYMQVRHTVVERSADKYLDQGRSPQLGLHHGVAHLDDLTTLYLVNASTATNERYFALECIIECFWIWLR
jgi:hypothetical protein